MPQSNLKRFLRRIKLLIAVYKRNAQFENTTIKVLLTLFSLKQNYLKQNKSFKKRFAGD